MNLLRYSLPLALLLCLLLEAASGAAKPGKGKKKKVCFPKLGCFGLGGDFDDGQRRVLPSDPESVGTSFRLFSRTTPAKGLPVNSEDVGVLKATKFNPKLPLKFVIHGFNGDGNLAWMKDLVQGYLNYCDVNVLTVNWERGASTNYIKASANARIAGSEVALMIQFLQNNTGIDLKKVHLIGFSLGAHVAGYAGKRFPKTKLGRVTGLDPAGPLFEIAKPKARLCKGDADFVDVVHTNAGSILQGRVGLVHAVGHADFYVNGGSLQNGCIGGDGSVLFGSVEDIIGKLSCSHYRAVELFISSIRSPSALHGYTCSSYEKFLRGECFDCSQPNNCVIFGHKAKRTTTKTTKYYMQTASTKPFVGSHLLVEFAFPSNIRFVQGGRFHISFNYADGKLSKTVSLPSKKTWFQIKRGGSVRAVTILPDAGDATSLNLRWEREYWVSQPSSWGGRGETYISSITVFNAVSQKTSIFKTDSLLKTKINYVIKRWK